MIVVEPPSSGSGFAASLLRKPELARFLKQAKQAVGLRGEVTVLLAGDERIRELNHTFRKKNKATDVLSFPAAANNDGIAGDLAISLETAARQAQEHGHSLYDEVRVLMLHGLLHLHGHDHEADSGEMRALESSLRKTMDLPGTLIERTEAAAPNRSRTKQTARAGTGPGAAAAR